MRRRYPLLAGTVLLVLGILLALYGFDYVTCPIPTGASGTGTCVVLDYRYMGSGIVLVGLGILFIRPTTKHLVAGGLGVALGCTLSYFASLYGWAPRDMGGYMQWGIPFPWHDVATGNGDPTIGPFHYVNLFNLGLDLIFWSILAAIVVGAMLSVLSSRARVTESGSLAPQTGFGKTEASQGPGHG